MIKMNKYVQLSLADFLCSSLTRYRMIPALYTLAREMQPEDRHTLEYETQCRKALAGLKSVLRQSDCIQVQRLSDEDILEMVDAHKNWIQYTFYDMVFYFDTLQDGVEDAPIFKKRMEYYLPAMAEIVNSPFIDWRRGTFDTGVEHPTVLDIGSGDFPFVKLFRRDNNGNLWYIGVDKRGKQAIQMKQEDKIIINQYVMEIENFLCSRLEYLEKWKQQVNTVFFGNSLHCMKEPIKLLEQVAKLPSVTKIMVLEFAPQSALNFMFDFHVYMHAGTGDVPLPTLEGWFHETSFPTTQHIMHTYTKKKCTYSNYITMHTR